MDKTGKEKIMRTFRKLFLTSKKHKYLLQKVADKGGHPAPYYMERENQNQICNDLEIRIEFHKYYIILRRHLPRTIVKIRKTRILEPLLQTTQKTYQKIIIKTSIRPCHIVVREEKIFKTY